MSGLGSPSTLAICLVAWLGLLVLGALRVARSGGYASKPLMTANEREFFGRLVRAHAGGYVFAQVAMSGLLEPKAKSPRSRLTAFRRISQKRIDYTLHDRDLSLLCVVELDDQTHDARDGKRRDRERDAVLRAAGIKTLRFPSRDKPSVAQLRSAIAAVSGVSRSRSA